MSLITTLLLFCCITLSACNISSPSSQEATITPASSEAESNASPLEQAELSDGSVKIGQTVTIADICEFTVADVVFARRIVPRTNSDSIMHFETTHEGKVFADIQVDFKNLKGQKVSADEVMSAVFLYNDADEYQAFIQIETSDGGNFSFINVAKIGVREERTIHLIAPVPIEVCLLDDVRLLDRPAIGTA